MRELIVIKATRGGAAANLFDTPARQEVPANTPIDEVPFEMPRHRGKRPIDLLGTRDADYLTWVYENVNKRCLSDGLYRRAGGRKAFRLFPGDPGYAQDLPQPIGTFSREYGHRFAPVDDIADDDIPF